MARKFAKYTGMPGIVGERSFSARDLESLGIEDAEPLVFNSANLFMVEITDLDPRVEEMLRQDGDFSFTESDNPRPPKQASVRPAASPESPAGSGSVSGRGGRTTSGGSTATSTT